MAERNNRLIYTGLKTNGTTRHSLYALRSLDEGVTFANPALPFSTTNQWWLLTESVVGANAYFYKDIPKGWYKLQVYNSSTTTYSDIAPFDIMWHGSYDTENHILGQDVDMGHFHDAIKIALTDISRYGSGNLRNALENAIGATWQDGTDNSLKSHLDDTTDAHDASSISCTVSSATDVETALDSHETRITALETGTAVTPSGIHDFTGDLGIDIFWLAQDIAGIEYSLVYLWKHIGETVPTAYTDLSHFRRTLSPEHEILYSSRRFDLTSSINTNLVLYYAIGAKGRADSAFTYSAVQSINVTIPTYTQEFSGVLNGLAVSCAGGAGAGVYALDSVDVGSDENFPTATEAGGSPVTNYIQMPFQTTGVTITAIEFFSYSTMSSDAVFKYRSSTTGVAGTFTVTSSNGMGKVNDLSEMIAMGDELQVWSLDPRGASHWRLKVWFTRG